MTRMPKNLLIALVVLSMVAQAAPQASASQPRVKVLSAVGDGLRYYVEYEFDGQTYRTDTMGARFNQIAWELMSESDKRLVGNTYAFSPGSRKAHFGEQGSAAMATWINDVTGWTAAGELWKQRIGARDFPELAQFYSKNSDSVQVGDRLLSEFESEIDSLASSRTELKSRPEYFSIKKDIQSLRAEYAAGKSAYATLVDLRARQIGNAFKAGSAQVIPMIVDGFIVGHVTRGAAAVSDLVANTINVIKQCVESAMQAADGASDDSAGTVLEKLWQAILKIEELAVEVRSSVENRVSALLSAREALDRIVHQIDNATEEREQAARATAQAKQAAIQLPVEPVSYTFHSNATDEAQRIAEIRAQVIAQAEAIRGEYEALLGSISTAKQALLDALGAGYLPDQTYSKYKGIWVFTDVEVSGVLADLAQYMDPYTVFSSYKYAAYKSVLSSEVSTLTNKLQQSHDKLKKFYQDAMSLLDDSISACKEVQRKVDGLTALYQQYVDGSLAAHVYGSRYPQGELEALRQLPYMSFPSLSDNDFAEYFKATADVLDTARSTFNSEAAAFESTLASTLAPYQSLRANLENAAGQLIASAAQLKRKQQDCPYIIWTYGGSVPTINLAQILGLINAKATNPEKEAETNRIVGELITLRDHESDLSRKISIAKTHVDYYQREITRLLAEIPYSDMNTAQAINIRQMLGYDVLSAMSILYSVSSEFYSVYSGLHNVSNASQVIAGLRGQIDQYYDLMFVSWEIQQQGSSWLSLPKTQFDERLASYRSKIAELRNEGMFFSITDLQRQNVGLKYNQVDAMLVNLQYQYGLVPVTGVQIAKAGTSNQVSAIQIEAYTSYALEAIVLPGDASDKSVTWTSSDSGVASVTPTGMINAFNPGQATITVRTTDGGFTAQCTVTVVPSSWPKHTYYVDKTSLTLMPGASEQVTAYESIQRGPDDEPNVMVMQNEPGDEFIRVQWTSSNPQVATVTQQGLVTAVAQGNATITVVDLFTEETVGTTLVTVGSTAQNPYDLNGDGLVTSADVAALTTSYGRRSGQHSYEAARDFNRDGVIDLYDVVELVKAMRGDK